MSKSNKLDSNIQTNITERLTPCLQKKIDKITCLVEVQVLYAVLGKEIVQHLNFNIKFEYVCRYIFRICTIYSFFSVYIL